MKRLNVKRPGRGLTIVCLIVPLMLTGCVLDTSFLTTSKEPEKPVPTPVVKPNRKTGPVTADQVNETNAAEKAKALDREFEIDPQ